MRAQMGKEKGVWVFDTGKPVTAGAVREMIRKMQKERERRLLGKKSPIPAGIIQNKVKVRVLRGI